MSCPAIIRARPTIRMPAMVTREPGAYRSIGINRNDFVALIQLRPDLPDDLPAWSGSPTPPMP